MNGFVADPHWGGWVVAYFFLGGIAGGTYFLAVLWEWFGGEEEVPFARIAYRLAFPLIVICGLLLIVDLYRPERFWHMLLKSEVTKAAFEAGFPFSRAGWRLAWHAPAFKHWSPISLGTWGLTLFGACTFLSFLATQWPARGPGRWLQIPLLRRLVQVFGCISGFFIASYTGTLLSATNQPIWSNTQWLASLFLVSAISTSLATFTLVAWWQKTSTPRARERLSQAEPWALILEAVVLVIFLLSLGDALSAVLTSFHGWLLMLGVFVIGIGVPLALHGGRWQQRPWIAPASAAMILLGGLVLRYSIVNLPAELLSQHERARVVRFSPESARLPGGGAGADFQNYVNGVQPRTKLVSPAPRKDSP